MIKTNLMKDQEDHEVYFADAQTSESEVDIVTLASCQIGQLVSARITKKVRLRLLHAHLRKTLATLLATHANGEDLAV